MLGVQAQGCNPMSTAHRTGNPVSSGSGDTLADSIAVCAPRDSAKALRALGVELAKVVPPVLPQAGPIETVRIECRRGHPISQLQGAPPEDESCGT